MPIEFRCLQCGKLLRTGDDTAGKQAKCPSCGSIQQIPASSAPAGASDQIPGPAAEPTYGLAPEPVAARNPFQQAPAARSPDDEANPYRSPAASLAPDAPPMAPGQLRPSRIFVGDVLTSTWEIYRSQMGMCIAVVLACGALNYAIQIVGQLCVALAEVTGEMAVVFGIAILSMLAQFAAQFWLTAGQTIFMLRTARGEEAPFTLIFSGGPYVVRVILGSILFFLIVMAFVAIFGLPALIGYAATRDEDVTLGLAVLGGLLAIVPWIYVSLMLSQFQYLIIDRNAGVLESFQLSSEITRGNKLSMFGLLLLVGLINLGGLLACCVGLIFTAPYGVLLLAVMYLGMSGQPTADQWQRQPPGQSPAHTR